MQRSITQKAQSKATRCNTPGQRKTTQRAAQQSNVHHRNAEQTTKRVNRQHRAKKIGKAKWQRNAKQRNTTRNKAEQINMNQSKQKPRDTQTNHISPYGAKQREAMRRRTSQHDATQTNEIAYIRCADSMNKKKLAPAERRVEQT